MKIITSKSCGLCKNIERILSNKGIEVEHIDIKEDFASNFCKDKGVSALPVLIVNEDEFYVSTDALMFVNKRL